MNTANNLPDLLKDPDKVASVPQEEIPAMRGELAMLDTLLLARLLREGDGGTDKRTQKDRLLKVDEAAKRLGASKDYIYRHAAKLPFTVRIGRQIRSSEAGIDKFIRLRLKA